MPREVIRMPANGFRLRIVPEEGGIVSRRISDRHMLRMMQNQAPDLDYRVAGSVDGKLATLWGCKAGTAHQRRFGRDAINRLCADVIRVMRQAGELEALAVWARPIEEALAHQSKASEQSPMLRAALADVAEDDAEARFREDPCADTARALLRQSATERRASLDRDRDIAERFGIPL
jgi:hypothetical protein